MNVKEYKKLTQKPPKYRAKKTAACPKCWNEVNVLIPNWKTNAVKGAAAYCYVCQCDRWDETVTFDSHGEQKRGAQLKAMERKGLITGLRRQVRFNLFPMVFFYHPTHRTPPHGGIYLDIPENYPGQWPLPEFAGDSYFDYEEVKSRKNEGRISYILKKVEFYVPDFVYRDKLSKEVIEDFKGHTTRDAKRKIILFEKLYGVKVSIVKEKDLK